MNNIEIGTVRQISQRLRAEGFQVGEYTLRVWIKSGCIPAVYCGKKALVSYQKVLAYINAI